MVRMPTAKIAVQRYLADTSARTPPTTGHPRPLASAVCRRLSASSNCPEAVIAVAYPRYPSNLGLSINRLSVVCLLTGSSAVSADWLVAARKRVLIDRRL
jgi:hypothetical protein